MCFVNLLRIVNVSGVFTVGKVAETLLGIVLFVVVILAGLYVFITEKVFHKSLLRRGVIK